MTRWLIVALAGSLLIADGQVVDTKSVRGGWCSSSTQLPQTGCSVSDATLDPEETQVPWDGNTLTDIAVDNGNGPAAQALVRPDLTEFLQAVDYVFNIPDEAIIDGVRVEINYGDPAFNPSSAPPEEHVVQLILDGVAIGENKSTGADIPDTANASVFYGSATDDWNANLSSDIVNDTRFGVQFRVIQHDANTSSDIDVDTIRVTVYYHVE